MLPRQRTHELTELLQMLRLYSRYCDVYRVM